MALSPSITLKPENRISYRSKPGAPSIWAATSADANSHQNQRQNHVEGSREQRWLEDPTTVVAATTKALKIGATRHKKNSTPPTSHQAKPCHLDRSAAQWRDSRIGSLPTLHHLGAPPFAHFAKGGVSSYARPLSSIAAPIRYPLGPFNQRPRRCSFSQNPTLK